MNKRQYKKYVKKYNKKSYYNYRYEVIKNYIRGRYDTNEDGLFIYIIDSRKGNLKHLKRVQCFTNVYPVSINK